MIYLVNYSSNILIEYLNSREISFSYTSNNAIKTKGELEIVTCTPNSTNIVYCSIDLTSIEHIKGNNTYILLESIGKGWKKLVKEKNWIEILKIDLKEYNKWIGRLRKILTPEAYDYFIDRYYNYPSKVKLEIDVLAILYKEKQGLLTEEELRTKYEGINSNLRSYVKYMGSKKGRRILYESSNKELWLMFIGTDIHPPIIYRMIKDEYQQVFSLIRDKVITYGDNLKEYLLLVDTSIEIDKSNNYNSTLEFVLSI
jgi:hypothetical protein